MAEGAGEHGVLIQLSVAPPKKLAKSVGNSNVSPRSSVRSKWTSFYVGPQGEHSVADLNGEWGHPVAFIGTLSGHVLLSPTSWIPTAGAGDEAYLKSSAIVHPHGVGMVGLDMARYICGVSYGSLWRCLTWFLMPQ